MTTDLDIDSATCPGPHVIHRTTGITGEVYKITCGDTTLNTYMLNPSSTYPSSEIHYFCRATMADHERVVTRMKMQSILETIRGLEHEPWCHSAHDDCCGYEDKDCECNLKPLVREGYR